MQENIVIRGVRQNNLKGFDLTLPRNKLIVFTGLSGCGKSSLAFDTLYAEGQRRYVESLSSYARQFLGQMEKPDVDAIDGLSPAISIDQKTTSKNPRSTVGTVTEIHDYLRLLYARVGVPHCPKCGREIAKQTVDQMVDQLLALPERTRMQLLAPVIRGKKGEHVKILENVVKQGFVRVRIDGEIYDAAEAPALAKQKKHNIEVVVDRLILREDIRARLTDSLETALSLSGGVVIADIGPGEREMLFSQNLACPDCGISMEELAPRSFSFNSPFGACPTCAGLGMLQKIDPDLIVPDWGKSLNENPFNVMGWSSLEPGTQAGMFFQALSEKYGFSMDTPLNRLSKEALDVILYGSKGEPLSIHYTRPNGDSHTFSAPFEGVIPTTERRAAETQSDSTKAYYDGLMSQTPCPDCGGKRLRPEILAVTVGGKSIAEASDLSVLDAQAFFSALTFGEKDGMIAAPILKEIISRLRFLIDVGLGYLTLSRAAGTLSGGEAQRIRLATQIGSSLVGVLYILDEPSIGLHQRDNARLIETLKHLRDIGNTLIVVEHDEDTMLAADQIVGQRPVKNGIDQAAFPTARYPRDAAEHAQGKIHVNILQIVLPGPPHRQPALGRAPGGGNGNAFLARKILPRDGTGGVHHILHRALGHDMPPVFSRARADIHQIIRAAQRFLIVLHHDKRVSQLLQMAHGGQQPGVIPLMQADGGLVQNIQHPRQPAADLGGQADALGLAARKRGRPPGKGEVFQAHVAKKAQAGIGFPQDGGGDHAVLFRKGKAV